MVDIPDDDEMMNEEDDEDDEQPQTQQQQPPVSIGKTLRMDPEEEDDEDDEEDEEEEEEEGGMHDSFIQMGESKDTEMESNSNIKQEEQAAAEAADTSIKEEEEETKEDEDHPSLGGDIETKAFGLLDGVYEKDGVRKRVTIPLTRLPAVLGRSHTTGDINFFSLGPAKALSRQHCVIDYRDAVGGKLITPKTAPRESHDEGKLVYDTATAKPFTAVNQQGDSQEDDNDNNKEKTTSFPSRGAFVLEALGKNLIMVGSHRIRQGEVAILTSGTPIRMNAYSLYFLLPTDTQDPPKTIDIPLETPAAVPPAPDDNKSASPAKTKSASSSSATNNKRKMPSSASSPSSDFPKPKIKAKKPKAAPFAQLQAELDALPIETLLERMNEAVESERWERKHQLIGSTISLHAVKDATSASEIREQAADGGVPRTEIMRWIKESPKYAAWVKQMMSKMEAKSYQNTITKALLKAGNVRTGSGGRYIKWILPGVTLINKEEGASDKPPGETKEAPKDGEEEEEMDEEDGNDDDEEEDDEAGDNNNKGDEEMAGGEEQENDAAPEEAAANNNQNGDNAEDENDGMAEEHTEHGDESAEEEGDDDDAQQYANAEGSDGNLEAGHE
ncbi:expressed unknown protein [Seminavis robusta]|uniref:FHA domain-containing protein n=1 Tax=Seminavis robusta TaxID=568900 RepID=A0A9N8EK22_9STRA|nr:expressed unknown protein [Seminavis robusta]|eukprot:Sro1112_g242570.1 n/a (615) ;mRNA; f:29103-31195